MNRRNPSLQNLSLLELKNLAEQNVPGLSGNALGQYLELKALNICPSLSIVKSVRLATESEDMDGIDLVVVLCGEQIVKLQIKASRSGSVKRRKRKSQGIKFVYLNIKDDDLKIKQKLFRAFNDCSSIGQQSKCQKDKGECNYEQVNYSYR